MKLRILLTENIKEVAAKLAKKWPDKYNWLGLSDKISEFCQSPTEAGMLLLWISKQLLDDNAHVEYHGEMTKEMQLLEAVRLFTENKNFLKKKSIGDYQNQPEVLAAVREGLNSPAALRAREKRNGGPVVAGSLSNDKDREYRMAGTKIEC
jgi:hypothetical protein